MSTTQYKLTEEILATGRKSMAKLVDNLIQVDMDHLETYEFPQDEAFGLEVIYKEAVFYFIIKFSSTNKNFICMSPGAFRRDRVSSDGEIIEPPHFSRWSWFKYFDESVITSADPTIFMNDTVKVGWMIGNNEQWYLETLSQIISKLAKNQNVINDNILFFGSSGGGFVSVCLATLIKNSKVLVNNAQFSLKNYFKNMVNVPIEMAAPTYDGLSNEEIKEKIKPRLDLIELIKKEDYAPHITYYVNVKSANDVKRHSIPLIEDLTGLEQFNGLNIIYYSEIKNVGDPHHPLRRSLTLEIIRLFAKNNLYNSEPSNKKEIVRVDKYPKILEKKVKSLENKNAALEKKIYVMENSHSWKITKPLRQFMDFIRKR